MVNWSHIEFLWGYSIISDWKTVDASKSFTQIAEKLIYFRELAKPILTDETENHLKKVR